MAIDANVLVFERAREEYAARGSDARDSGGAARCAPGFDKAWSAIVDSNVTTLHRGRAAVLPRLGAGPGFGVTLGIGVLASMVSALVITRVLAEFAVRTAVRQRPARHRRRPARAGPDLARDERDPDLIASHRRCGCAISARSVARRGRGRRACAGSTSASSSPAAGCVEYSTSRPGRRRRRPRPRSPTRGSRARWCRPREADGAEHHGAHRSDRQRPGAGDRGRRSPSSAARSPRSATSSSAPPSATSCGRNALIALGVALLAQLAYLAVRFRWTFGAAAVLAMLHDVLILVGVFAWLGRPVDGVFLAALLTVIGYSVNDSVVVFDRVRELVGDRPPRPVRRTSPTAPSCRPCRARSTPAWARCSSSPPWLLLGGDSLADFALALLDRHPRRHATRRCSPRLRCCCGSPVAGRRAAGPRARHARPGGPRADDRPQSPPPPSATGGPRPTRTPTSLRGGDRRPSRGPRLRQAQLASSGGGRTCPGQPSQQEQAVELGDGGQRLATLHRRGAPGACGARSSRASRRPAAVPARRTARYGRWRAR